MGLFGPNIKKMKEKRDIKGLVAELNNGDIKVRIDTVTALADLRHKKALLRALKNDDSKIRCKAITALEKEDDPHRKRCSR